METTLKAKSDATKIQEGDVFSRFSCGTVVAVDFDSITLKNTEGLSWTISKNIVENEFSFASHVEGPVEAITRTEMIELVRKHPRVAMQITFTKKPDESNKAALARCYQSLFSDRQRSYERYADVTLNYFTLRNKNFGVSEFIKEVEVGSKRNCTERGA